MKTKQEILAEIGHMDLIGMLDYALSIADRLSEQISEIGAFLEREYPQKLAA